MRQTAEAGQGYASAPIALGGKATDLADAIRIANAVPSGLGASVWTNDAEERARFERDIEAGMIAANAMLASSPEAPFGGIERSDFAVNWGHMDCTS